ncbi:glycosyltransferase [Candidatus Chrysopegis kryptomonas]|jgi:glycosyltransferase involved in cell wall biosynthesis|uniref:Glycosyl transferases group 1 n=1 Tax=Candidatus Chryseopegocella kryptomonas TaxID=1633643 RepID=A0A0P1MLG8_9BACT|nr:glycosyltransferase [Candidatus Chrysopegis kryptomonas]CUS96482.1 Glycosyl transferases group 1 [Candidatus Chrysopegis kryptomonas]
MKKIDLVIIPYNDFLKAEKFGFRSRDQHLMRHIMRDDRIEKIVIVERPRSIWTLLKFSQLTFHGEQVEKIGRGLRKINDKIFLFEFFEFGLKQAISKYLWYADVYGSDKFIDNFFEVTETIGIEDAIVVSFNPFANDFIKSVKPKFFVFDAMDNFCFHPEFKSLKSFMCKSFEWISVNADLIFCVNENVKKFFKTNYPISCQKLNILPNGVERNLNSRIYPAEDVLKIKSPRIGYVGVISERIDFELVEYIASERKEYNFIFIGERYGKVGRWMKRLKKLNNIYFLGVKHYEEIPSYIATFDVCIVPHKVDDFTLSNDPMKIYEYLYFGKPVVATPISISEELRDYVFIGQSRNEFLHYLDDALNFSKVESFLSRQRNAIKEQMFWDKRAEDMIDKILSMCVNLT